MTDLAQALAHHQAGRLAEAEAIYRSILAQQPHHADALHLLGLIALAWGRFGEALDLLPRAIALAPAQPVFRSNLGEAYRRLGRLGEAIACFRQALALQEDLPDTYLNLAAALNDAGCFEDALASCRRALALRPDYAEAHNNMGRAYSGMRRHEEAIACYRRALALQPESVEALNNLGNAYAENERWDEAIAIGQRAATLQPGFADAHSNLGVAWRAKGDFAQAQRCYREAIACRPDLAVAHWNLALLLLLGGHYEEGWREYEWRWRSPSFPSPRRNFSAPQWSGALAPGVTILLHAEQGFGDTLQFLRYVPVVRAHARAGRVLLECPAALAPLLAQNGGWDAKIVARHDWSSSVLPPFDLHLPLMSLPLALGRHEPLSMTQPYLRADPLRRAVWRERLGPAKFRVGLAWAGSSQHREDRRRSIEFEKLRPLLRVPNVSFYSLQIEPRATAGVIDFTGHLTDFAETAALMAELDLIISVDTAAAHLAGALGRPVWTLLPFVPDWRWGLEREDTPWYPTMRLFRQPALGDWDSVVQRVANELSAARTSRA